jgi:hypothetical protein
MKLTSKLDELPMSFGQLDVDSHYSPAAYHDITMEGPDQRLVVDLVRKCHVSLTCLPNSEGYDGREHATPSTAPEPELSISDNMHVDQVRALVLTHV